MALNRPDAIPQQVSRQLSRMESAIALARRDLQRALNLEADILPPPARFTVIRMFQALGEATPHGTITHSFRERMA